VYSFRSFVPASVLLDQRFTATVDHTFIAVRMTRARIVRLFGVLALLHHLQLQAAALAHVDLASFHIVAAAHGNDLLASRFDPTEKKPSASQADVLSRGISWWQRPRLASPEPLDRVLPGGSRVNQDWQPAILPQNDPFVKEFRIVRHGTGHGDTDRHRPLKACGALTTQ
jgi:hypothetical protein